MDITLFIICLAVFSIAGFLIFYFNKKQSIKRKLKSLEYKSFSSLRQNEFVKIRGKTLESLTPLVAPLSKRKCVYYIFKIQQRKSSGKNNYWDTIVNDEKIQDFFIEKNGDTVLIQPKQNPKNYKSYLVTDSNNKSSFFDKITPELEALLSRYSIENKNFFGMSKRFRYSEAIIEIGEEITVAGIVKWKSLNKPIEGYSYSKILSLASAAKEKIIITDLPLHKK